MIKKINRIALYSIEEMRKGVHSSQYRDSYKVGPMWE